MRPWTTSWKNRSSVARSRSKRATSRSPSRPVLRRADGVRMDVRAAGCRQHRDPFGERAHPRRREPRGRREPGDRLFIAGVERRRADVMELVRDGVFDLGPRALGIEGEEDGRVARGVEHEAVRRRLDHQIHRRADDRFGREVGQGAGGGARQVGALPGLEGGAQPGGPRRRACRDDESPERVRVQRTAHRPLALVEPRVAVRREEGVPVPGRHLRARGLPVGDSEDRLGLRRVDAHGDPRRNRRGLPWKKKADGAEKHAHDRSDGRGRTGVSRDPPAAGRPASTRSARRRRRARATSAPRR